MIIEHPVRQLLLHEGLPGFAALHQYAETSGLSDTSSVTIDPTCRVSCDYMITKSAVLFGIYPRYLRLYAALRQAGDPSGMFGFGAKRHIDGAWVTVGICEQIALIAGAVAEFERQHLLVIDKIAQGFATIPLRLKNLKDGTRLS